MPKANSLTGVIRINQKRYTDAYIDNPDEGPDIYIESRADALEGDVVEVELNHHSLWRIRFEVIINKWDEWSEHITPILSQVGTEQSQASQQPSAETSFKLPSNLPPNLLKIRVEHVLHLPFALRFIQKTGSVIRVIKRNSSGIAGGFLRSHSLRYALFSPIDSRVPRMLIDIGECPLDFNSRPDTYKNVLFVARIIDWPGNQPYASGNLVKIVGDSNSIQSRIEAILMENQILDEDFPADVYEELKYLDNLGSDWLSKELHNRRDLTNECIFTIDPKTARDLDDAVSIRQIADQIYELGVHIADVSHFVREMSLVDYQARLRTTSVYLVDRVIHMLPRVLCEQMCSLKPGQSKLTFSVIWKVDKYGHIIDEWFGKTMIKSCAQLSYEQAQNIIDTNGDISWIDEGVNMPALHGFDWRTVAKAVILLNKIAKNLRATRFEKGALKIEQLKLKYELDEESGYPVGFEFETRNESNYLIEEYMLLANMAVAKRIYKYNEQIAFLRRHPPSPIHLLKDVKEFCDAKGCPLDISSSLTIQKSLNSIADPTIAKVVSHLLLRAMKNAEYICAGSQSNDGLGFSHFALNVPFYTHFTSPIRRYADIVVHRQLALALEYESISHEDVYSLSMIAAECTKRKLSSKLVSDTSQKLYFNLFVLRAGFCELLACVTKIYDNSFDVILVDYDRVGRVYLDKLKPHLLGHKFQSFAGIRSLELSWDTTSNPEIIGTKKGNKRQNKKKSQGGPDLNSRSNLESSKAFCIDPGASINEGKNGQQVIEVFDLIRVIVTTNKNDITQLNIDLKIPGQ